MIKATIDNKEIQAENGTTVLQAALANGIDIPHYCYHPALKIDGNCRMCLVEVEKMPKLTIACNTTLSDGMVVITNSEKVEKARKGVLEFLLINHPLDCPVCDKSGECGLQDNSFRYGLGDSRFKEKKITQEKKEVGKHILHYSDRCILCARCVRFCSDVSGTGELNIVNRGGNNEIDYYKSEMINNKLSGNVVDICPVGALKSKEFLFKRRVWYLKKVETICPRCSTGCNIVVDVSSDGVYKYRIKESKVYRVTPRHNPFVNGYWMCDEGRYDWSKITSENRLQASFKKVSNKKQPVDFKVCLETIKTNLPKATKGLNDFVGAICSGAATNEDNYALSRLIQEVFASSNVTQHTKHVKGEDEKFPLGFTIEANKNPNYLGTSHMIGEAALSFDEFKKKISDGKIKALFIMNSGDKNEYSDDDILLFRTVEFLVVFDSFNSKLAKEADIVISSKVPFERCGTFTNSKGIVQKLNKCVNAKEGILDGWLAVSEIAKAFDKDFNYQTAKDVFSDIAKNIPEYQKISFETIDSHGTKV